MSDIAKTDDRPKPEYQVGYKKPPKSGQFKKGKSGNPAGRKKEVREHDMGTILDRILSEEITDQRTGERLTTREAIMLSLRDRALKGDSAAAKKLAKLAKLTGNLEKAAPASFVQLQVVSVKERIFEILP